MYPKDYIKEVLIDELGDIVNGHPYISFSLICSGIEFLGICLDEESNWTDRNKSEVHFVTAINSLFPSHYAVLANSLYGSLRCGLVHCQLPGGYSLTELKNEIGELKDYSNHLVMNDKVLVIEHFYSDFLRACELVIANEFPNTSKMNESFLKVS